MSAVPDDLEKLLADVRKTITDNRQFLSALSDESVDPTDEPDPPEEASQDPDEYEEL